MSNKISKDFLLNCLIENDFNITSVSQIINKTKRHTYRLINKYELIDSLKSNFIKTLTKDSLENILNENNFDYLVVSNKLNITKRHLHRLVKKFEIKTPRKITLENKEVKVKKTKDMSHLQYLNLKYKNDIQFKLKTCFSANLRIRLKNKKILNRTKTEDILKKKLGYTIQDLIKHLEKQFDDKMNWDNYGEYWHIDHIFPESIYIYSSYDDFQFKECWSLKNLRPLSKFENILKSDKIIQPFQTMMII